MSFKLYKYIDASSFPVIFELRDSEDDMGRDWYIVKKDNSLNTVTLIFRNKIFAILTRQKSSVHLLNVGEWIILN
jgi:hypothetical protein